jgi:hypothetical protein
MTMAFLTWPDDDDPATWPEAEPEPGELLTKDRLTRALSALDAQLAELQAVRAHKAWHDGPSPGQVLLVPGQQFTLQVPALAPGQVLTVQRAPDRPVEPPTIQLPPGLTRHITLDED